MWDRATRIIEAGKSATDTQAGEWRMEEIRLAPGYAEPGYTGEVVALGNWNSITRYDSADNSHETLDVTPVRVGELLEKAGVEIEWSDEWAECHDCQKVVRTQPDSYSWTPSYILTEDGIFCEGCTLEDPEAYLADLDGNTDRAITLDINPEDHGYIRLDEDYAAGWYGRNDSPQDIGEALRERGIYRFVFRITGSGQFETSFCVYIHEDEAELLESEDEPPA
jgi:hypothetical protein